MPLVGKTRDIETGYEKSLKFSLIKIGHRFFINKQFLGSARMIIP
jgi:hypothetical protein